MKDNFESYQEEIPEFRLLEDEEIDRWFTQIFEKEVFVGHNLDILCNLYLAFCIQKEMKNERIKQSFSAIETEKTIH